MRRILQELRRHIEDFVEQREDLMLLASCTDNDSAILLKVLRDLEQSSDVDIFLLFGHAFEAPGSFVAEAIEQFHEQHALASQAFIEAGKPPLAAFPEALLVKSRPPLELLHEAISFARSLFPSDGGHRLVWAMVPEQIVDRPGYNALVSSFVPKRGIQPWMRGLRLVFRESAPMAETGHGAPRLPRVRLLPVDLGPAAIQASFEQELEDPSLSQADRMQALLSLASLDHAQSRFAQALEKYKVLLGYYQQTENHSMQALVMHGIGDVSLRSGTDSQALHWYECALVPAVASKAPVILAIVVKSLGDLAYAQERYAEAERYFDGLDQIAARMLDPEGKARALEWRGLSQEKQGAVDKAVLSWEAAAGLSREVGLQPNLRSNLEHLSRTYRQLRMKERLAEVEAELNSLPRQEKHHA